MKIHVKTILLIIFIAFLYIIVGRLGLNLAFENPSASPVWAATGIALAAMIIFGFRVTPAIFIGAFVVNQLTAGTILTSLGIALGNTLEAIVGYFLVTRYAGGPAAFERIANIFRYTLFVFVSTCISATVGVLTLISGNLEILDNFTPVWLTWWLGDLGGAMVVTPLIIVWWTHPRIRFNLLPAFHLVLCFIGIYLVTELIFSGIIPYPYLYIPLAVWISFWFGRRGATVATLLVAAITIYYTLSGRGPFVGESLNASLVQLQIFLSTFSLTALIFATIILEIRRGEKTLAYHEQRFKALIEKSFDAVVLIDATSKILYSSPSVKRLIGYTPEELEGMVGFDLIAPEDKQMTIKTLAQLVLKPGGVVTIEYRVVRKEKTIIWVEATGTNLLLDPHVNAVIVNFHDITEKKLAREKLLTEKMEDEAMLASIGEGIVATDYKGEIAMINQAGCEMLGWKEKELIGKRLVEAVPMQDEAGRTLPQVDRPISKVLSQKKSIVTSTNYYVRKDGSKFPIRFTLTPIILDEDVVGTIEVFYDVTKEKEIDKAKSEFVSVASHQLRTPLTSINWYIEELLRIGTNLTEKESSYMKEVHAASKRMITLVNALLNVSRIELGSIMVEPKNVDVLKIVAQVLHDNNVQVKQKNITVQKHFQDPLPWFSLDPKLFTIIMQNLISNALKYSKQDGKIDIKISHSKKGLFITVADQGHGIPKSQQSKIFTKLFRADNARNVDPDGNGLGLYVVKEILDAAGGKITFTSEENKGTVFSLEFPPSGMQQKTGKKLID